MLWFSSLYKIIQDIPGDIIEMGSQWGASLNIMASLLSIYEPYNPSREILSFSTFEQGFVGSSQSDSSLSSDGDYSTTEGWASILQEYFDDKYSKKIRIFEGDASRTVLEYLNSVLGG